MSDEPFEIILPDALHLVHAASVYGGTAFTIDGSNPVKAVVLKLDTWIGGKEASLNVAIPLEMLEDDLMERIETMMDEFKRREEQEQ